MIHCTSSTSIGFCGAVSSRYLYVCIYELLKIGSPVLYRNSLTDNLLSRETESPQGQRSVQFSGCVLVLLDSVHSVAKCFHCHLNLYLCDGLVKVRMWCWTATRGQALVPCGTCCVVSDELVTCSQRLSVLLLQVSSRELLTREIYTPGF